MERDGGIAARAAAGMARLHAFYDANTGVWSNADKPTTPTYGWWNSANALETTIDYMDRSGDDSYDGVIANTYAKTRAHMASSKYYDDEGWWALAWIKAHVRARKSDSAYLQTAETIFAYMCDGWTERCGGGIFWDKKRSKKNAIANELYLSTAARLHLRNGGRNEHGTYLDLAQRAWAWFASSDLIDGTSNLVRDDLGGDCKVNSTTTWSYNQGVILGGLLALREATHDDALLGRAKAIADAALGALAVDGILREPTADGKVDANAAQFKGIFIRNLTELYKATREPRYGDAIAANAESVWTNAREP